MKTAHGIHVELTAEQTGKMKTFVDLVVPSGEPYYLLAQPLLRTADLSVRILTESQGKELAKWLIREGLAKKARTE